MGGGCDGAVTGGLSGIDEGQVIPFGPDECDEYAEHDEGLGLGNFKPEEIPVPHPQCLCAQWAVIPDSLEDIGARIGAWASGEPQPESGRGCEGNFARGIEISGRWW